MDKQKWTFLAMGLAFTLAVAALAAGNKKTAAASSGKDAIAQAGTPATASPSAAARIRPFLKSASAVAVGTALASGPRTDPGVRC